MIKVVYEITLQVAFPPLITRYFLMLFICPILSGHKLSYDQLHLKYCHDLTSDSPQYF